MRRNKLSKGLFRLISLVVLLVLVVVGVSLEITRAAPYWWNTDWQYRMKLTFDNSASNENLVNFPVLVQLTSAHSGFWTHINSSITANDTRDLRFVDTGDLTELYFEVEKIDYTSQDAVVWVNVPQIDTGSTTDFIYVYYGNAAAAQSAYHSASDVWDSNYLMVQHMNNEYFNDSTVNNNDGTNDGTSYVVGQMGEARSFNGSGNSVAWSDTAFNFDYDDSFTFHYWQKTAVGGDFPIAKGNSSNGYRVGTEGDGDISVFMKVSGASGQIRRRVDAFTGDDIWHHVVITYNGSRDVSGLKVYVDGSEPTTQGSGNGVNAGDSMATTFVFYLGRNSGSTKYWYAGALDEVRISNTARSADWIETSYINQNSPSNYYTVGSEEELVIAPGDASGDGVINNDDVAYIGNAIADVMEYDPACDANEDGNINAMDITQTELLAQ